MPGALQELLPIAGVRQGCIVLKGGRARAALEARPVNFVLRPPAEQEAMVASFRAFLHSLSFPLQIVVRSMPAPVDDYLAHLRSRQGLLMSPVLKRLAVEHEAFVRRLAQERTILERRIYVVVPADPPPPLAAPSPSLLKGLLAFRKRDEAARLAEEQLESTLRLLEMRVEQVLTGLVSLGIPCRRLSGQELVQVLHDFLGSSAPLPQDIAAELLPVHIATPAPASGRGQVKGDVLRAS